tara:strand:+ start:176 stop:991 length:816 start_codon:yes stop_codon:yes gene_type:complete
MNVFSKKVGFIGAGNMASAIISGMITAGFKPKNIIASAPTKSHLKSLSDTFGINTSTDNEDVYRDSEIVIFAVKPHKMNIVLEEFNKKTHPKDVLIISLAAGLKIINIEKYLPSGQRIIRAMPNTPSSIREGVTAICQNKYATINDQENAETLFLSVGEVHHLQEQEMDIFTALIGSGPAYVFYLIESLLESASKMKMEEKSKKDMIASMIAGSARLAYEEDSPLVLRKNVTSPGGVTERAIEEFEKNNLKKTILKAIEEAINKSKELGEN